MRLVFVISLFIIPGSVFAQEIFKSALGDVLSLNAVKKDGDKVLMKVLSKDGVSYIEQTNEQTGQLSFRQYIDTLLTSNLKLVCSGDEPFWNLTITKDKTIYNIGDENIDTNMEFYYPQTDDYWLRAVVMFKSVDNAVFGSIERMTNIYNINEEEITFLHCRVCIDWIVYVGTVSIEENKEL